jgi:hypothetical protein
MVLFVTQDLRADSIISKMKKTSLSFLLVGITAIGAILRLHALSPFKFYPDAYQNLLVAENIRSYHSVVGYLGESGSVYPPFVMWSRPGYPLLINLVSSFFTDAAIAAQMTALFFGIAAIPVSFFLIRQIFGKTSYGLAGASLLAISFNHTLWSGYIMTETTGVFFLLLFLWSLTASIHKLPVFASWQDIRTGILLGCCLLVRYEYAVLCLPLFYFIWRQSPKPFIRISTISFVMSVFSIIIFMLLFPVQDTLNILLRQNAPLLWRGIFFIPVIIMLLLGTTFIPTKYQKSSSNLLIRIIIYSTALLVFIITLQIMLPGIPLRTELAGLRSFIRDDFFLSIFSLIGLYVLINNTKWRQYALLVIFTALVLGLQYHRVNPTMERYWTHLIPFFLIPASYGLVQIVAFVKKTPVILSKSEESPSMRSLITFKMTSVLLLIGLLTVWQTSVTSQGFRNRGDRSWYRMSYEEKAARMVASQINNKQTLLIASFPEPYYFFTNISTHSIADSPPYIYIPDALNDRNVIIIQDMGMYDIFPRFSKFLTENMQDYRQNSFSVNEYYHYGIRSEKERFPITIYQTTLGEIKKSIQQ